MLEVLTRGFLCRIHNLVTAAAYRKNKLLRRPFRGIVPQ